MSKVNSAWHLEVRWNGSKGAWQTTGSEWCCTRREAKKLYDFFLDNEDQVREYRLWKYIPAPPRKTSKKGKP